MLSKIFFGRPKKMALGVRKWPFLAKNFKFWPKMAIFSGPKIFKKKFFFALKYILDHFKSFPEKKIFEKIFVPLIFLALVLGPHRYIYICIDMLDFRKKIFDKKCLKIPKNNFKLGPKLIFEKQNFFRPQVVPWDVRYSYETGPCGLSLSPLS